MFVSNINLLFEPVTFRAEYKRKSLHIVIKIYVLIYYFQINIKLIHSPCLITVFINKLGFFANAQEKTLLTNYLNRL